MERQALRGLRPQSYEHPLDRKALDALQNTAGLDLLVRKVNEWGFERIQRVTLMGSHLRVTSESLPEVNKLLEEACYVLDLPRRPTFYVSPGAEINAYTSGSEHPIVVLSAAAIDQLTEDELFFVIAHELGHVKSGHTLYYQLGEWVPIVGSIIGQATLGIGELISLSLQVALLNWKRMSEFTADRAGLLATQDANVAISAMAKLAGLPQRYFNHFNTEDFVAQARALESGSDEEFGGKITRALSVFLQTHPWTVQRAHQFLAWIDSGGYAAVLNAPTELPVDLPFGVSGYCTSCGLGLSGTETYCIGCGIELTGDAAISAGDG